MKEIRITKPIVLIGMMGAGKSTVGARLAARLELQFFDLDDQIEQRLNKTVREIFASQGEEAFRKTERETLQELVAEHDAVIALGGGSLQGGKTIDLLRRTGRLVYLQTSADELEKRLRVDVSRPLLQSDTGGVSRLETLSALLAAREQHYMQADIIINTNHKTPEQLVEELAALLDEEDAHAKA